nr:FkbM family methyltransferase [uncultured Cohaesibacter sp.]
MTTTSSATLFGQRFALDRWKKQITLTGWLIAPAGTYCIDAELEGAVERVYLELTENQQTSSSGEEICELREQGLCWTIELPLPDEVSLDFEVLLSLRTSLYGMPQEVISTLSIPLALFEDVSLPRLVISQIKIDHETETFRISGWWGGGSGRPSVGVYFLGQRLGTAKTKLHRIDVYKSFPWLGRFDLGWEYVGDLPSRSPEAEIEVRLEQKGFCITSMTAPLDKSYAKAIKNRHKRIKLLRWVNTRTTETLFDILASKAFMRRWKNPKDTTAVKVRDFTIDALVNRREITNDIAVRMTSGALISVNVSQDTVLGRKILLSGNHENDLIEWLERFIQSNEIVIEAGAGYGVFSIAAAGYGAKAQAIEASASMSERLLENSRLNGVENNVNVLPAVLHSQANESLLFLEVLQGDLGASTLVDGLPEDELLVILKGIQKRAVVALSNKRDDVKAFLRRATKVRTISLDSLCQTQELKDVAVLKLDTNGSILSVLQGGGKLLSGEYGLRPIIIVEIERLQENGDSSSADMFRSFKNSDWTVYTLMHDKKSGIKLHAVETENELPQSGQVFYVPPERQDYRVEAFV